MAHDQEDEQRAALAWEARCAREDDERSMEVVAGGICLGLIVGAVLWLVRGGWGS